MSDSVVQLWKKNQPLARSISQDYYLPGSDREDVLQEAMIGLWVAARQYDSQHGSFRTFAALVIKRHLVACLRGATRKKHIVLNASVRMTVGEREPSAIVDQLPYLHQVVDIAETREQLALVIAAMSNLTEWERECILGVASGMSYLELGDPKMVDNTLYRARRKLKEAIETV